MWSELSARHLLALRAVAQEGTFGKAAERLGFTQSAVSQQVAALEQMVGQPLFDRPSGPRRPELTPAGRLMLDHATSLIEQIEQAEHDLGRFARGVSGKLAIGSFQSVSARVLPSALSQLHRLAPDIEVNVVDDEAEQHFREAALDRGDIDLAFVVGDSHPDCETRYLGDDPHVAIVPASQGDGPVDLNQLSGRPMIGQPVDDTCGMEIDRALERLGVTPNYVFRSHDNGAVQGMVRAGVGIAVVPLLTVDTADPGIAVCPTVPAIAPRRISLAWAKGRTLSPIAERFVEIAVEVCAELLADAPYCDAA